LDLTIAVNQLISEGYKPQGGVAISIIPETKDTYKSINVCQAMVKED